MTFSTAASSAISARSCKGSSRTFAGGFLIFPCIAPLIRCYLRLFYMWFARLLKSYGSKECSLAGVAERHLSIHLLPAAIELYFHFVAGPLPVQGQVQIHLFGDRAAIDACQDIAA